MVVDGDADSGGDSASKKRARGGGEGEGGGEDGDGDGGGRLAAAKERPGVIDLVSCSPDAAPSSEVKATDADDFVEVSASSSSSSLAAAVAAEAAATEAVLPAFLNAFIPALRHFHAVVRSEFKCRSCGKERDEKKEELYRVFSLDLVNTPRSAGATANARSSSSSSSSSSSVTPGTGDSRQRPITSAFGLAGAGAPSSERLRLEDLLATFFADEDRELACEKCRGRGARATATLKLTCLPNVLVVHLKRSRFRRETCSYAKVVQAVQFPAVLAMDGGRLRDVVEQEAVSKADEMRDAATGAYLRSGAVKDAGDRIRQLAEAAAEADEAKEADCGDDGDGIYGVGRDDGGGGYGDSDDEAHGGGSCASKTNLNPLLGGSAAATASASVVVWACTKCTLENAATATSCEVCNNPRAAHDASPPAAAAAANAVVDLTVGDDENGELTGAGKGAAQAPGGGWRYRLRAVVRHMGSNVFSGHYICDTFTGTGAGSSGSSGGGGSGNRGGGRGAGSWQRCDDSIVSPISEEAVLKDETSPYILFYERE